MSRLTKKQRDAMPSSEFADPKHRKYPIPDAEHARAAAGFAGMHDAPPKVKAAIRRKAAKKGVKVKK